MNSKATWRFVSVRGEKKAVTHRAVIDDIADQGADGIPVVDRPEAQEVDAAQLAAELLADSCAGQAEAEGEQARAFGDERLA